MHSVLYKATGCGLSLILHTCKTKCPAFFFDLPWVQCPVLFALRNLSPHLAFVKCFHSPSHQTFSTLSWQPWARRSLPPLQRAVSRVSTTFQTTTISVFLEPTATSPPSWWHKDLEPSTTSPWSPRNQWRQGRCPSICLPKYSTNANVKPKSLLEHFHKVKYNETNFKNHTIHFDHFIYMISASHSITQYSHCLQMSTILFCL